MIKKENEEIQRTEKSLWNWGLLASLQFQLIWIYFLFTMNTQAAYTEGLAILGFIGTGLSTLAFLYFTVMEMLNDKFKLHPLLLSLITSKVAMDIAVVLLIPSESNKYSLWGLPFGLIVALIAMISYKNNHKISLASVLLFQAGVILLILVPIIFPFMVMQEIGTVK